MSSLPIRQIASHYLLTQQGWLSNPLLTLNSSTGEIIRVEQYDNSTLDSMPCVEFYSGILCRGFVNAHCHLELSYLKGAIQKGGGYASFASSMAEVRNNFTNQQRAEAIQSADFAMWNEGVNVVADIVNDSSSFATKSSSRIDYHSFAEVFGLKQSNLERCKELTTNPKTSLTPHSVYSVQQADFAAVCNNNSNTPLSIHFKESSSEEELFSGRGSLAEWYQKVGFECDFLHYKSPAERVVNSIPADRSIMFVHNCCVTERDIDLIMSHFTAPIYWVLCPRSNRYISGELPKVVELLRKKNLNICIGTDSLASNDSLSILEELKCFTNIPLAELLTWATDSGYAALQLQPQGLINICGIDTTTMSLTAKSRVKRVL